MHKMDKLTEFENLLKELNSTPMGRKAFLASIPLLMAACSSSTSDRKREGDNTGQKVALTPEEERKLTEEVLPQMKKDYPPVQNSNIQSYISKLGMKIVNANNLDGSPYKYNFTVVDVNYINAFALPAGTVFVTAPLIAMAESEAELAGVVGHEIGHIQARHTAERMQVAKDEEGKGWLYAIGGGAIGAVVGAVAGKAKCPPKDNACIAKATAAGAVVGAAGGLLVQKYKFMANSREDEMEADRIGFKTAVKADFSKVYIGKFYEKLLQMEKASKKEQNQLLTSLSDAMSTHPPSTDRVKQMNEMIAQTSQNSNAIISTDDFESVKKYILQKS